MLRSPERIVAVAIWLFSLAMAGLLWQMHGLSDQLAGKMVFAGTEIEREIRRQTQTSYVLTGIVGVLGLTAFSFAILGNRRTASALRDLVHERTSALIAAKQQAEQTASEKAALLATVEAFFIRIDPAGTVCEWTCQAEKLFGILLPQAIARPFQDLSIRWNWESILSAINQATQTLTTVHLRKVALETQEGRQRFLKLTLSPLCKDSGIDVVIMGEDVTDHLLIEHDLAQAQKLESIGQLAAGIAHEINTPTQFVGDNIRFLSDAFTDLLPLLDRSRKLLVSAKTGVLSPDVIEACDGALAMADLDYVMTEIPRAIAQSVDGIDRIGKIVRAMKDFAHPDTNELTCANLNDAITSTVTVSRNEWKYVAELTTELDPDLPLIPCRLGEINQVILNLIVNAAHAIGDTVKGTGQKGLITISSRRVGEWAEIRVTDTGTGIPENIRHRIFDPFFTTKEVGRGTGQGLAISRSVVVDKHGGSIAFDTQVGKGTTFIVRLPVSGAEPGHGATTEKRAA
jgi:signal transduction histidine kinase